MPAYEYICDECHQSFSLRFPYASYGKAAATCPHCGSTAVTRRIGKVRIARSKDRRSQEMGELADRRVVEDVDRNPAEVGRLMRALSRESGAEMGEQFDDVVDRLEHGQTTGEIEKDLPEPDQDLKPAA